MKQKHHSSEQLRVLILMGTMTLSVPAYQLVILEDRNSSYQKLLFQFRVIGLDIVQSYQCASKQLLATMHLHHKHPLVFDCNPDGSVSPSSLPNVVLPYLKDYLIQQRHEMVLGQASQLF